MKLIARKDIRAELYGVRHQGRRPTCLAFAASDVHRHARQHPEYLCVEWLYYHVSKHARTGPHDGTTIPDTRAILRDLGQPDEPVWPYSGQPPSMAAWQPPSVTSKLMKSDSVESSGSLRAVRQSVEDNVPVVIGMFISDTFNFSDTWERSGNEVILGRDVGQSVDGTRGHAVVVVGHGEYDGDPVILLRNSWGPNWGNRGHAWVRETYLSQRLAGAFFISKGDSNVLQSDGRYADAHTSARLG